MTSSYRKTVEKLAEQSATSDRLPCSWCHEPTARATLANYGARCLVCYEVYCRKAQPAMAPQPPKARNVLTDRYVEFDPVRIEAAKILASRRIAEYAPLNRVKDGQDVSLDDINAELRASGDLA